VGPSLILLALTNGPLRLDARTAWFNGPMGPLVIPVAAVPDRAARILVEYRLPLGERVATALRWGAVNEALRAAATWSGPLSADPTLDGCLRQWGQTEAARLGLAWDAPLVAIGEDGLPRNATAEERAALSDVQDLLATLAWPRWRGPLVLVPYGVVHHAIAPGVARIVRPVLPVLRPPPGGRAPLAVAIAELAMALSAPPPAGWPGWLSTGLAGCAEARALGSGIPERAMAERRAAAGPVAIRAQLDGSSLPDIGVATAVVAGLLHPTRRRRFPDLLELLRHGSDAVGAVQIAYGLSPEGLATAPGDGPPPR